jgi:hypothetical protein
MRLSELKNILSDLDTISFLLPNGEAVPSHFHVTEIGQINKRFIDCGGTLRSESVINFQLWSSSDYDHRLGAEKLQKIIALSERELGLTDDEIEVEYQSDTIGKYGLSFLNGQFILDRKRTDCLAKDNCGIPAQKPKIRLSALATQESCCAPNSGCC